VGELDDSAAGEGLWAAPHERVNNSIADLILVDSVDADYTDYTVAGFAQQIRAAIAAGSGAEQ
jgi:hypothetical protein